MGTLLALATSGVGLAAIGVYVYVGVMIGRASSKAGSSLVRAAVDGALWPVSGWAAIEKLYKTTPTS